MPGSRLTARLVALTLLVPTTLIAFAGAAAASCAVDERSLEQQITEAPIVFVGTATDTSSNGGVATFLVEEQWKGQDELDTVTVRGGGEGGTVTSVDRYFQAGARYLVFPLAEGAELVDNSCTPTREWTADLGDVRPASARVVSADGGGSGGSAGDGAAGAPVSTIAVAGIAVLVGLAAAGALLARRRSMR